MTETKLSTWEEIAADVSTVVGVFAPVVAMAVPPAAAAITLGAKIVQGAIAFEPTALRLYNQIVNGTPVTPQQLAQFELDYEASYQKLDADIKAKLAALPPE